jgi:hypothetical protein
MNSDFIKLFNCPKCGSKLKLKEAIWSEDDGVVVDGLVICDNKHELEIRNTILILYKG